ncbi:hypothetical protein BC833DRAFT_579838 [Globomyces pollinis-pini]|nr:hypothetical protein BC833DRAFT_579838 [Globomyces pollinis-pini]
MNVTIRNEIIQTSDNFPIATTHFSTSTKPPTRLYLIASATGVIRKFYKSYATYLVSNDPGSIAVTFDYRGIGDSFKDKETLKDMKYVNIKKHWVLDTETVLGHYKPVETVYIAHSVGGHIMGFLDQQLQKMIIRAFFVGVGIPYYRNLSINFLWPMHTTITPCFYGHYPASMIGMGEDLPTGVGQQWGYWSRFPDYLCHNEESRTKFKQCNIPIEMIAFHDDFLPEKALYGAPSRLYVNTKRRFLYLDPKDFGFDSIGHLFFFKQSSERLWKQVNGYVLDGNLLDLPGKIYSFVPTTKNKL